VRSRAGPDGFEQDKISFAPAEIRIQDLKKKNVLQRGLHAENVLLGTMDTATQELLKNGM